MPRRRVKVARGIYRDQYGLAAVVYVGPQHREKRFPPGTPLRDIRTWQDRTRIEFRDREEPAQRHSFAADVERYLRRVRPLLTSYSDRAREIGMWLPRFRERRRSTITTEEITTQLYTWRQDRAASTCNHRRDALSHFYRILDGRRDNPVTEAVRFALPPPETRSVPRTRIAAVLGIMQPSKTRARLRVLLWTGMRASQLQRMARDDVDLEAAVCYVPRGKGGEPVALPVPDEGVDAWREFIAIDAWGSWSVSAARVRLHAACRRRGVDTFGIHALRHAYATELRRGGADLADVQELLGHRDIRTTMRYAPVVSGKLREAVNRLAIGGEKTGR